MPGQPRGGVFTLSADDVALGRVDTSGTTKAADFAAFTAPVAASTLELRVAQGHVRLFGITAENTAPGVVYDSLGLDGASITCSPAWSIRAIGPSNFSIAIPNW